MKKEKNAHWIIAWDDYYLTCSNCRHELNFGEIPEFCPKCGANMKDEFYYFLKQKRKEENESN